MSKVGSESVAGSTGSVSGVLVGRFDHALDPKKRFTIPSEWRTLMGNPGYIYVMPDPEKPCLRLVPQAEMDVLLGQLREKALFDPSLSEAYEMIGANSRLLPLDVQGRIRVCDELLQFANLTTTVAMVGAVRTIRLWNPAALAPAKKVDQKSFADALRKAGWC